MIRNRSQRKLDVDRLVLECRRIANEHIRNWTPVNKDWKTIEGCAYLRLSTDDQVLVEKGSLETQVYLAIAEAENRSKQNRKNYRIVAFYIDAGISGTRRDRVEFIAMKRAIRSEIHKFATFKEVSRIARDSKIWKEFFQLCQIKKCEVVVRGLPIDPNDPGQVLQLDILASFAEYEAAQTGKRIRESVFTAMVRGGKFNSTHVRLGLDPLVVAGVNKPGFYQVNEAGMRTVTFIMETFVKYGSHQKTLEVLNEKGIKNFGGDVFARHSLISLLTDTRYIGKWYLNAENKNEDQDDLPERERYHEIDLPHGELVPIELWNKVQKTVTEICGNRGKNTRVQRVYPLSGGLLKFHDGTRFRGCSGTGKTSKSYYYFNQEHGLRIKCSIVEEDAIGVVTKLISNSPELQQAIRDAGEETQDNIQFLKQQITQVASEIAGLEQKKKSHLKKMDLLMGDDVSEAEIGLFRREFAQLLGDVDKDKADLEMRRMSLEKDLAGLKTTSFSWQDVSKQAQKVQEVMLEKDPVALKNAMHILFKAIEIGPEDNMGVRTLKYILTDDFDSPEDEVRLSSQMVEAGGIEPPSVNDPH